MFTFLCKNRIQINPKLREYCIKSTNESIRKLSEKYNQERTTIKKDFNFETIKKEDSSKANYIDLIISFLSSTSFLCFLKNMFFMLLPSSYYYSSVSDEVEDTMPLLRYFLPTDLDTCLVKTDIHEPDNVVVFQSPDHPLDTQSDEEPVLRLVNNDNIEDNYDVLNILDDNIVATSINVETDKKTISTETSNVNINILMDWLITDFCQDLR